MVEVLLHAPPSLTPAEKLLLTVIAESCNPKTRMTWYRAGWDAEEVARRSHLTAGSLSKTFWSLAQKGCEVRVAHGIDKRGRPVFAFKGKQTTFRLPVFAPQRSDEDRTIDATEDAKGPTYVAVRSDEDRGFEAQRSDEGRTLLLKELPSKNTSSLSRQDSPDAAPSTPAQRSEREMVDEDSQTPEPRTLPHRLLMKNGAPEDQLDFLEGFISSGNNVLGNGWWITADRNGSLADHIAEGVKALDEPDVGGNPPWCGHCDERTRQRTTEWMENISVSRCPECHPLVVQTRTEEPSSAYRPSTSGARARQGLAVADSLDRQFGHGRYQPWQPPADQSEYDQPFSGHIARSPADQRMLDAIPLYNHYKALEDQ